MKTRILVNRHIITRNRKTGERNPPLGVKQGRLTIYAHEVNLGFATLVYRPDKPLTCGATVWIEMDTDKIDPAKDIKIVPMDEWRSGKFKK